VKGQTSVRDAHDVTVLVERAVRGKLRNAKGITVHVEPC